ncbi:MAG: hypothetical protein K0S45_2662 [Nitrospira sp.]|jgi:uncharacterized membrane protein|nr:hypothetical protein [Nitrospira sp.]
MLPQSVPFPREVVLLTGLCEISGAMGLMMPRRRRLAAILLILYLICETPTNVKVAVEGLSVTGMPKNPWFYRGRLCLIPLRCGGHGIAAR